LNFYKQFGFIPYDSLDESVTITLEYAYDDWCVAQMAKALGKDVDYKYFLNRSKAYRHLFDQKLVLEVKLKTENLGMNLSTPNIQTTENKLIIQKVTLGSTAGLYHKTLQILFHYMEVMKSLLAV
jgi:hypothetical protein